VHLLGRASLIAATLGVTWLRGAFASTATLVDVTVRETAGVARHDVPTEAALPFARGALRTAPDASPSVEGADARVLERWPDGSIRWLLVDFPTTIPARGRLVRHLSVAPRVARRPASGVRVDNVDGGIRAESPGKLTLTAPERGTVLAEIAAVGAPAMSIPWPTVRLAATVLQPPRVERVEVETSGGRRSVILVQARQAEGLRHEVRFTVVAGQPWVRVQYTLTHMGEAAYLHLSSFSLSLPWSATRGELGTGGAVRRFDFVPPQRRHLIVQRDPRSAELDGADLARRADGVARVRGGGRALSVAVPWFWEEYPKALAISPQGIDVDFAAAANDPLLLGVGAAKTWELWIAVHPDTQAPPLLELGRAMTTPPRAIVNASRVAESGALPYALAPEAPGAATFLATLGRAIDQYRARAMAERWDDGPPGSCDIRTEIRSHVGFYGAFNWGDWNFPGFRDGTKGCDAWGNLEYDLPLVLGLAYLATGDPETWSLFENAARHYRDVDIIHHWPRHSDRVGLNHPHKVRHFATDAANTVDLGHVWLDGLLLHYRLTGEERSRHAVLRMADALGALTTRASNPRQFGWPMIALAAAYEATGEARYRTACLTFATEGARKFPPNPNAEWKMGILAEGMVAAHRATGDAAVRRWLDDYGRQLLLPSTTPRDPRLVAPAGYLFALTGDPRYAEVAGGTAAQLAPGNWGKPLASVGRLGFALLAPLARARPAATPAPGAPRPASAPEPPRSSRPHAAPSPPSDR
jgi:hypothetical protein